MQAAATYRTKQGTYVAFRANRQHMLSAFRLPPPTRRPSTMRLERDPNNGGCGSPFVTSTDGTNNVIVWVSAGGSSERKAISGYTVMMATPVRLSTTAAARTN